MSAVAGIGGVIRAIPYAFVKTIRPPRTMPTEALGREVFVSTSWTVASIFAARSPGSGVCACGTAVRTGIAAMEAKRFVTASSYQQQRLGPDVWRSQADLRSCEPRR